MRQQMEMESTKTRVSSAISFALGNHPVEEGRREGERQREEEREEEGEREEREGEPPSFVIHCDGNIPLKYTADFGRLVFHFHYAGVKSNFILVCLVRWSIVRMTFCNMMQHKAINHTESE